MPVRVTSVLYKIAVVLLLLVVGTEIFLRIAFGEQLKTRSWPMVYAPDSLYGYTYIPGASGLKVIPTVHSEIKINSLGFHCREFSPAKDHDAFRIFFVGRSEISGFHLNNYKEHFAFQLEQLYKEKGYRSVEVYNCGIDGRVRDLQNLLIVRNKIISYNPDLVLMEATPPMLQEFAARECYRGYILQYKLNSEESRRYCLEVVDNIDEHPVLTFLYDKLYTVRAVAKRYLDTRVPKEGALPDDFDVLLSSYVNKKVTAENDVQHYSYTVRASMKLLKEVRDLLKERGCEFRVFAIYAEDKLVESVLAEHDINTLFLQLRPPGQMFNRLDRHLNKEGHTLVASRTFGKIDSLNIIPDKFKIK